MRPRDQSATRARLNRAAHLIADAYGVRAWRLFLGESLTRAETEARTVLMWCAKAVFGVTYEGIGRVVGCHHTTAMHAHREISERIAGGVASKVLDCTYSAVIAGVVKGLGEQASPLAPLEMGPCREQIDAAIITMIAQICCTSREQIAVGRHIPHDQVCRGLIATVLHDRGRSYPEITRAVKGKRGSHSTYIGAARRVREKWSWPVGIELHGYPRGTRYGDLVEDIQSRIAAMLEQEAAA